MSELNPKQAEALEKMRAAFSAASGSGLPMDDFTFLRYLRARFVCIPLRLFIIYLHYVFVQTL